MNRSENSAEKEVKKKSLKHLKIWN